MVDLALYGRQCKICSSFVLVPPLSIFSPCVHILGWLILRGLRETKVLTWQIRAGLPQMGIFSLGDQVNQHCRNLLLTQAEHHLIRATHYIKFLATRFRTLRPEISGTKNRREHFSLYGLWTIKTWNKTLPHFVFRRKCFVSLLLSWQIFFPLLSHRPSFIVRPELYNNGLWFWNNAANFLRVGCSSFFFARSDHDFYGQHRI